MTLLDAYYELGPLGDDPALNARRQEAARVLDVEANAHGKSFGQDIREEAKQKFLSRWLALGPRSRLARGAPKTDHEVKLLVRTAVTRACIDEYRSRHKRGKHERPWDETKPSSERRKDAAKSAVLTRHDDAMEKEIQAARSHLFKKIAVGIAKSLRTPDEAEAFRGTVARIDAMDLKNEPMWPEAAALDPEVRKARNVWYTKKKRALEKLRQEIERLRNSGELQETRFAALRLVLAELLGRRSHKER